MVQPAFAVVDLEKTLAAERLPAVPQTAARLLKLSRDPSSGPAEFAVVIDADPGLTLQVLRLVNSSYYGFRRQISSVRQAIALVGIRTIRNFVLWQAVFKMIPAPRCCLFDLKALWRDSLRRALFARALGKLLEVPDAEEAFTAGLLQDMAIPLLVKRAPEAYSKFFYARSTSKRCVRISQLERQTFGWDHAMAAGMVARQWHLPETLAELIEGHLAVDQPLPPPQTNLGKLAVAMSAMLPASDDTAWIELAELDAAYAQVRPLEGPSIEDLLRRLDEQFTDIAPLLGISPPQTLLVERYQQAAGAGS